MKDKLEKWYEELNTSGVVRFQTANDLVAFTKYLRDSPKIIKITGKPGDWTVHDDTQSIVDFGVVI